MDRNTYDAVTSKGVTVLSSVAYRRSTVFRTENLIIVSSNENLKGTCIVRNKVQVTKESAYILIFVLSIYRIFRYNVSRIARMNFAIQLLERIFIPAK